METQFLLWQWPRDTFNYEIQDQPLMEIATRPSHMGTFPNGSEHLLSIRNANDA